MKPSVTETNGGENISKLNGFVKTIISFNYFGETINIQNYFGATTIIEMVLVKQIII